jgi:hypothetical protein
MKKFLFVCAIAAFAACNNSSDTKAADSTAKMSADTTAKMSDSTGKMAADTTKKDTTIKK